MKSSEHKTNKINYGAMTIKVESKTTDDVNYEVRITDDTLYRSDNISDKIIAVLSFNTINPDSLKIIGDNCFDGKYDEDDGRRLRDDWYSNHYRGLYIRDGRMMKELKMVINILFV